MSGALWQGEFGDSYTARNSGVSLPSVVARWARMLARAQTIKSAFEIGTNVGYNLDALRILRPDAQLGGVEINPRAHAVAAAKHNVDLANAAEFEPRGSWDLAFTSGVLIHIVPDHLPAVYDRLLALSSRYILVSEYYNPTPVVVPYRGQTNALFKRDFAGELIDRGRLTLVDYGFFYHRDPFCPADDPTWFLLEKRT